MKIITSILVGRLSGAAGDVVAATWKGRQYARTRVVPANPQLPNQMLQRTAFARCVACFQALPDAIKLFLDTIGSDRALSGYNVMMAACVHTERAEHKHIVIPPNTFAESATSFAAATGDGQAGDIDLTWDKGSYIAEDIPVIAYRLKNPTSDPPAPADDEYSTPWVLADIGATTMATQAHTISDLEAGKSYAVLFLPYDLSALAYGGGAAAIATSKA